MNSKTKVLISIALFASLAIVSCGNKPREKSNSGQDSQTTSDITEDSTSEEQSSEENSSSESETTCKDDLHSYVRYIPVDGGHQKACETCNALVGEKVDHAYFDEDHLYCPSCGYYDAKMTAYMLSDDFNVKVRTAEGTASRKIISNLFQTQSGGLFTLSSPSNAHGAYNDFDVEGARFYYDNEVDDGTKLFMLKESASRVKIGTCKTAYTYTLSVYSVTPGSFSYQSGHVLIGEQGIVDWLSANTASNQITYKYLYTQHHAEDYRVPITGTNDVIVEVTCQDCGEFLYQEIVHND